MATARQEAPPKAREDLTEEEARVTFERLELITRGLFRVSKDELDEKLAEKRSASRHKRLKPPPV